MMAFYIVKSLENGQDSLSSSTSVAKGVAKIDEVITGKTVKVDDNFRHLIRKYIGHYGYFVLFGIISILLYLSLPKLKHYIKIIINYSIGFIFAFMTEFLFQLNAKDRNPSFLDVMIDFGGFVTLSSFIVLFYYIKRDSINYKKDQLQFIK
jgi:VanZ family protein